MTTQAASPTTETTGHVSASQRQTQVVEHFDQCSASYHRDAFTPPGLRVISDRDLAAVYRAASLVRGRSACDIGVGTGRIAEALTGRGFDVVGIEASQAMIDQAHQRLPYLDIRHCALPGPLPLPDRSVDLVSAMRVLKYVEDWRAAIGEIGRVLTAGGVACFDLANARSAARFGYPAGLVHFASYHDVCEAIEGAGLAVVEVRNGVHLPDPVWRAASTGTAAAVLARAQQVLDVTAGRHAARSWTFIVIKRA